MLLSEVCENLLNNADLDLSVDGLKGEIKLEFHPAAFDGVITFFCNNFSRLNFRKDSEDAESIFVGETNVTVKEEISSISKLYKEDGWQSYNKDSLKPVVHIEIDGGTMLNIVCEKFSWKKGNGEIQHVL